MSKTVKRTMYYPTFNPQKNEFDYEEKTHERPMTERERKADTIYNAFQWISIMAILIALVLFFVGLVGNFETLGLSALGTAIGLCIITILLEKFWIEKKIDPIFVSMGEYGFETEILMWEQQTQEQNIIAQEWRLEHEFEELIRKAKLTANCTDIAKAAVYYAEHYIKGE